tara:strand:+ start:1071 stop:1361 length:291 start_codon:yes stop_codon:yes gene_type:complete
VTSWIPEEKPLNLIKLFFFKLRVMEKIELENFKIPATPNDDVWSEDGKVFCKLYDTGKIFVLGFITNSEKYPGNVKWKILSSGNGSELPVKKIVID